MEEEMEQQAFDEPEPSEEDIEACKEMGVDEEESKDMYKQFKKFDRDGNNYLDVDEIQHVLQCLGQNPSMEEAEKLMLDANKDDDNMISFIEFVRLVKDNRKSKEDLKNELKEAFEILDSEGNGNLDKDQLRDILCQFGEPMTDEEVEKMFEIIDTSEDGKIQYEELVNHLLPDQEDE